MAEIKRTIRSSAIALAAILASCGSSKTNRSESTTVIVRGVTYTISNDQIDAIALKPTNMTFVRVSPPHSTFDLVLDALNPYLSNNLGKEIPSISCINDNTFGKFEVIHRPDGAIICKYESHLHFDCGLEITDEGVKWGVLFDKKYIEDSVEIRNKAVSFISSYRGQ